MENCALFVATLLHSATNTHFFHFTTDSYSRHKALQKYYEGIDPIIDALTEAYQGKYGLIEFEEVEGLDNNASIDNVISYFGKLMEALDKLRKDEKMKHSALQNQIDMIDDLLSTTKYKLENLG